MIVTMHLEREYIEKDTEKVVVYSVVETSTFKSYNCT